MDAVPCAVPLSRKSCDARAAGTSIAWALGQHFGAGMGNIQMGGKMR
eukprot:COSAG02_NODE_52703_length_306_cov_0.748792_1_plen_46_part_01